MANREEPVHPWAVFEKSNMMPRSSAAPQKVKRGRLQNKVKRGRVQKKVTSKNPERSLRLKRSTIDFESHALKRAKEVQANLSQQFPSLIKYMLRSHVSRPFWLGLPTDFCVMHLPKDDTMFVLEDENGIEYKTKYLPRKVGLSGGWKGFSEAHDLVENDVLVFHLIQPHKFKVYISRSHGSNEVDVTCGLLHLGGRMTQHDSNVPQENDHVSSLMMCDAEVLPSDQISLDHPQVNDPSNSTMLHDADIPPLGQHENTSDLDDNLGSEVLNGIRLSESTITFQQVTGIENFSIVANGLVLDSELSKHLKTKYYELCCSQRMFLHENLLEGQNCNLVVGLICETINIADAIRASKITTSLDSFAVWYKSLKGLEILGMNVSFLLARLEQLKSLASKFKRYMETRVKQDQAEEEKRVFELKLEEVRKTISILDDELDLQNRNLESLKAEFHVTASNLW